MPLTPGNFASLLEPGLKEIFNTAVNRPRPMLETLFRVESSQKSEERYQAMGAMGLVPPFEGAVKYEDFDAGYETHIRNYEFALGMQVQRTLIDDEQYGIIRGRGERLSDAFDRTIETDAANIFINGFTDSGTNRMGASVAGADGVGLLSLVHPNSPRQSGATQANEGTLALSLPNLDTTRRAMLDWTDDKGELLGIVPDMLLVPPELERTATQIISERAMFEPGSAQYDVNMFAGKFRLLVWNRLTDSNAWFLCDSALMKRFLIWQWRIRPEFAAEVQFDTMLAKFRGYMRYGIGWTDWRFIYGNNPS